MRFEDKNGLFLNIGQLNTGFIEIPGQISMNIYCQGCNIGCFGCQNTGLQSFNMTNKLYLTDISHLIKEYPMSKWVCFLGGEPTFQPNLSIFCKEFKKHDYMVAIYTGKLFEDIKNLLNDIDVVIDGPWNGIPVTDDNTNQRTFIRKNGDWTQIRFNQLKNEIE
jgi:organic radical activating enzyme